MSIQEINVNMPEEIAIALYGNNLQIAKITSFLEKGKKIYEKIKRSKTIEVVQEAISEIDDSWPDAELLKRIAINRWDEICISLIEDTMTVPYVKKALENAPPDGGESRLKAILKVERLTLMREAQKSFDQKT